MDVITIMAALEQYTWILALAFIFSFVVAFGMGANDVANSKEILFFLPFLWKGEGVESGLI